MKCVKSEQCGCYDKQGERYRNQEIVPSEENCQIWYAIISCQKLHPIVIKSYFNCKIVYSYSYCDSMEIKCKYNSTGKFKPYI